MPAELAMSWRALRVPRALAVGLALSLLAHLLMIASPGLRLPFAEPPRAEIVVEARLAPRPEPAPAVEVQPPLLAVPSQKPARPTEPARPRQPEKRSEPVTSPAARAAVRPQPAAGAGIAPPVPVLPESGPEGEPEPIIFLAAGSGGPSRWPTRGEVEYRVIYGQQAIPIGTAIHSWWHDGRQYRMESVATASGVLSLFDALSYTQRSTGEVLPQGLRPTGFEVIRGGRRREWSEFDWNKGEVTLYRDGRARHAPLSRGDQDVLTLWHQIGIADPWVGEIRLTVVTGKSAAPSELVYLADEVVEVPAGRFEARHLRAAALDGSLSLEVWLARSQRMVPVRIRMRDRDGDILDQQASRITFPTDPAGAGDAVGSRGGK